MSMLRDRSLAPEGLLKIQWVKEHMPVLRELEKTLAEAETFKNKNIAICLHLEAKTAYMALVLKKAGANVVITGSNPLSTQDDIAAALDREGVEVYAWHGSSKMNMPSTFIKPRAQGRSWLSMTAGIWFLFCTGVLRITSPSSSEARRRQQQD